MSILKVNIEKFNEKLKLAIEGQHYEVGIIKNTSHKSAQDKNNGLKNFISGDARKTGSKVDGSMQEIAGELEKKFSWLSKPFRDGNEKQKEIQTFAKTFIAEIQKKSPNDNRIKNLVQAIVRNPILRGDYGSNKKFTIEKKGFDRKMIDTGQFFNSIKSMVIKHV